MLLYGIEVQYISFFQRPIPNDDEDAHKGESPSVPFKSKVSATAQEASIFSAAERAVIRIAGEFFYTYTYIHT